MAEAMKLTMPQIIMLNHAAWVNKERSDRRYQAKRENGNSKKERKWKGKDVRELNSDEYGAYWGKINVQVATQEQPKPVPATA